MRKYIFKTKSDDQRPIKHSDYVWAIIGCGIDVKPYWMMVMWLPEGVDVFEYYPEAYDVTVQLDKSVEIKRGGDLKIISAFKTLGFKDGITYGIEEINPTLLAIIEKLSYDGLSESSIAKRAGINLNKFKKIAKNPLVIAAINNGKGKYLEDLANML